MAQEQDGRTPLPSDHGPREERFTQERLAGTPKATPTKPDFAPASAEAPSVDASGRLAENRPCLNCGYDLFGLTTTSNCPECGVAVDRSLRGNLLRYSSRRYLDSLHRGVVFILIGLVVNFCLIIGLVVFEIASAVTQSGMSIADDVVTVADTGLTFLLLAGWWLFSSADPAIVGTDTGDTPRRTIRVTITIQAVASFATTVLELMPAGAASGVAGVQLGVTTGAGLIAWIVQFFAAMLYLRWLSPRLPNRKVYDRAKTLSWLGPVLIIFSCLVVPFLVALVLYWTMLNWVRLDLNRIREEIDQPGDRGELPMVRPI